MQIGDWMPFDASESRFDVCESVFAELHAYAKMARWAARPEQTPERILAALRRLEKLPDEAPLGGGLRVAHCRIRRFILGDLDAANRLGVSNPQPVPPATALWMQLPWERARALRLLNLLTQSQLESLLDAQKLGGCVVKLAIQAVVYVFGW